MTTKLRGMVGMDSVANEVDTLIAEALINRERDERGLPVEDTTHHLIFTGNPGTGKTTVARDIAQLYHALGVLPTDNFIEASRSDFVGRYTGETAQKTKALMNKAKGGVLFIDEAYALKHGDQDEYGQEAIDTLLADVENNRNDTVVILAGYPQEMEGFLDTNRGLRRRFPNRINFPNYKFDDLKQIMRGMLGNGAYKVPSAEAKSLLDSGIKAIAGNPNSGNAGDVRNLYEKVQREQKRRLAATPASQRKDKDLQEVTAEDVARALASMPDIPRIDTPRKKGALVKA